MLTIQVYPPAQKATDFNPWMNASGIILASDGSPPTKQKKEEPQTLVCGAPLKRQCVSAEGISLRLKMEMVEIFPH